MRETNLAISAEHVIETAISEVPVKAKKKTGRKMGYKMPSWNKALLASRRDSISLEAANLVLAKIGEALTAAVKSEDAKFIFTAPSGKKKNLVLVSCNEKSPSNQRMFLFKEADTRVRVNYVTQEIYDGIISGGFTPVTPDVKEALYEIIATSPEMQEHIRERAMRTKERSKAACFDEFDDGTFSITSSEAVDETVLSEIEKRSARGGK